MATAVGDGRQAPKNATMGPARPTAHAPPVAEAVHLSPLAEAAIRLLPGNDRCADCKAIYPQWAGVSFGVLLCLACAGKHRALGVSVSFVKSLTMDSWTATEQRALEMGGNAKWAAVCAGTATIDLSVAHKYTSPIAKAYKQRIQLLASAAKGVTGGLTANEFLAQLMVTSTGPESPDDVASLPASLQELPPPPPQQQPRLSATRTEGETRPRRKSSSGLVVKCTTCEHEIPLDEIDPHSKRCVVRAQAPICWRKYDRSFGRANESLGFSLTKTKGGFAEITRVTPGGDAEKAGVVLGSYVVGLNDQRTSAFKEIVALVGSLERPIHFHFVCRSRDDDASASHSVETVRRSASVPSVICSVPEPVTVETEAVFDETVREIGCVLQVQNNRCVVTAVDNDSAAQQQGVLVGSSVAAVNGRLVLRGPDAIEAIQKSSRPLRIKFHRVEGLMRGWKSS